MAAAKTRITGYQGEETAQCYLQARGMILLDKNFHCKLGEIDLIMQDGLVRVFVEVRLRAPTKYGSGYETVSYKKQRKIINTIRYYQQREDYWGDVRFDVVSIERDVASGEQRIEYIPHAFSVKSSACI